ncbi:DUF2171 domain-containing protein [Allosphingosinicella humi]
MTYRSGDYRYGGEGRYRDERWRERNAGRDYGRGDYRGREFHYGDDERGFFDRAGDEVRSWFGDEEAERRRERDRLRYEREQGWRGRGERDYGYYGSDYDRTSGRYPKGDYGQGIARETFGRPGGMPADTWGGSGFGGDYSRGRRFDRVDVGSTGTHGVHPMSSPDGDVYGAGYGATAYGYRSSAREAAMMGRYGGAGAGTPYDRNYSEWRSRQIDSLDRDYDEYRREHQSMFDKEFAGWREKRQSQRQSMERVDEHMEVVGSDGLHVGTVDCVKGDRIILTKSDEAAGGRHHSIPCGWIESVDDKVTINKSAEEARREWRDAENSRALFEREDQGSEGPHVLGRSFSGTY